MHDAAQALILLEGPACDPSLQLAARLVEIAATLLQGSDVTSNPSHAEACRRSARGVYGAAIHLLDELVSESELRRELRQRAESLGEVLNRARLEPAR